MALGSISGLISYLDLIHSAENVGAYTLVMYSLAQFMKLDATALEALHLNASHQASNKNMYLFGLLDKCKTAPGSRLLSQWIRQPLLSISEIEKRQELVGIFVDNDYLLQQVQDENLKSFPDLYKLGKKFMRTSKSLEDVVRVYQVITSLPALIECLQSHIGSGADILESSFITPIKTYSSDLAKLQELVETTIDLEATAYHEYLIKSDFHPKLEAVRKSMSDTMDEMKPAAERVALELNLEFEKKLKFEKNSQFGYHLRLSRAVFYL